MKKIIMALCVFLFILLSGPLYLGISGQVKFNRDWKTASRAPTQLLKPYHLGGKAVVLVMSAKAFNWRGMFSVHSWIAVKVAGQEQYTIYQILDWNRFRGLPIVDISHGQPDKLWFGYMPKINSILIGGKAEKLIPQIDQAVKGYPYADGYTSWPGPNSNTFVQYIVDQVPELDMQAPYNALGRDYFPKLSIAHLSLWGILGYQVTNKSATFNLFGVTLGLSWCPWGVVIPGVGLVT